MLDHAMGFPMETEERAAAPLSGGIANCGYQCGMLWGAALAAGARAYRLYGAGTQAETAAIMTAQRLVGSFRRLAGHIDCRDISGLDIRGKIRITQVLAYFAKGRFIRCIGTIPAFSKAAFRDIYSQSSGIEYEASGFPLSCTAVLAGKMGATDLQATMAAGLAGGIGLSGSGGGALGTAVWMMGIRGATEGQDKKALAAGINEMTASFARRFGKDFRCSGITGVTFKDIADHAGYVRSGGCREILDFLSGYVPARHP